jgi:hypothetical protein
MGSRQRCSLHLAQVGCNRFHLLIPKKESSSFLKKRTKKLLRPWFALPEKTATAT